MTIQSWWIDVMRYIREAPGKLYEDQLERLLKDRNIEKPSGETIDYFLNKQYGGSDTLFLKIDPVTKGIYTVPSQRKDLDRYIANQSADSGEPKYKYNEYLYEENIPSVKQDNIISMNDILSCENVFKTDLDNGILSVDLSQLKNENEKIVVSDFDINEIINFYIEKHENGTCSSFDFGEINAAGVLFLGNTCLRISDSLAFMPHVKNGMSFSEATFAGNLEVGNIVFEFDSNDENTSVDCIRSKVDFRNARFFGEALFRDISFYGDEPDMEISFEDARAQNSLKFINIDFGHASVNLFQTVIGRYVWYVPHNDDSLIKYTDEYINSIEFKNVTFSDDSQIDLSDAEMNNTKIVFENIPSLPLTRICLSPVKYKGTSNELCPNCYLLIKNCEIQKTLYIGNVSALSFWDSCNYGKIVAASNWGYFPVKKSRKRKTSIFNPLLRAIYNNNDISDYYNLSLHDEKIYHNMLCYSKAKDFVMMKENFNAAGKYDEEDEAFILYMEFKPYINYMYRIRNSSSEVYPKKDLFTDLLYRILHSVGSYGISPVKVIFSLSATVAIFSVIYYIFACVFGSAAFDIGAIGSTTLEEANWCGNILPSIIFSVGNIIPFVSQFEPINIWVCICTIIETAIGSFLVGYFSVAVVRKTLR